MIWKLILWPIAAWIQVIGYALAIMFALPWVLVVFLIFSN